MKRIDEVLLCLTPGQSYDFQYLGVAIERSRHHSRFAKFLLTSFLWFVVSRLMAKKLLVEQCGFRTANTPSGWARHYTYCLTPDGICLRRRLMQKLDRPSGPRGKKYGKRKKNKQRN